MKYGKENKSKKESFNSMDTEFLFCNKNTLDLLHSNVSTANPDGQYTWNH